MIFNLTCKKEENWRKEKQLSWVKAIFSKYWCALGNLAKDCRNTKQPKRFLQTRYVLRKTNEMKKTESVFRYFKWTQKLNK